MGQPGAELIAPLTKVVVCPKTLGKNQFWDSLSLVNPPGGGVVTSCLLGLVLG
jgi:hypothetical protein